MMTRNRFVGSLVVLALAAAAAQAESVLITAKHKAGEKLYVEQSREAVQKIENSPMGGGSMEMSMQQTYGLWRKVDSATPDGAKISLAIDRVVQKFDSPMMSGMFDSDDPDNEDTAAMMADPLKQLLGGQMSLEVDSGGKVTNFSGTKKIVEKVQEAAPGNMMAMQLEQELSEEHSRVVFGDMFYLMYPNKEVSVGDTWKRDQKDIAPRLGGVINHFEYKLDRISEEAGRKVAIITYKSTVEKDPNDKEPGPMHMKADLKGNFSGTATYDIEKGLITKNTSKGHVTVEMKPESADDKKSAKAGKKDKDADEDDEDEAEAPAKPMTVNADVKQSTMIFTEAEREKQKTQVKKSEGKKKEAAAKKPAGKKDTKPAKKGDEDDDDDDD